jgi:hypothetical protein
MPRQPRYFIPDIPQHIIQRGVDRQAVFFEPGDYELYLRRGPIHIPASPTMPMVKATAYLRLTKHTNH